MASIERAVLKGTIDNAVETRNMFTAEISEVGGDTSELLWGVYMDALAEDWSRLLSVSCHLYGYDVYSRVGEQWQLKDEVALDVDGLQSGTQLLNAAAVVIIGKAAGIGHTGRKFIGALAEANVDGNLLDVSQATNIGYVLVDYLSPVNGIGGGYLRPGVIDKLGEFHVFVGGVASNLLGTMRRRKPTVGI